MEDHTQYYYLVVIDKRTRFPAVEQTTWTSCQVTCDRLRKIFATHGVPVRVESDNGPPFHSVEFNEFAKEMGFLHHRVTPEHPRANGEAESFMKVLNKTEQIAHRKANRAAPPFKICKLGTDQLNTQHQAIYHMEHS